MEGREKLGALRGHFPHKVMAEPTHTATLISKVTGDEKGQSCFRAGSAELRGPQRPPRLEQVRNRLAEAQFMVRVTVSTGDF